MSTEFPKHNLPHQPYAEFVGRDTQRRTLIDFVSSRHCGSSISIEGIGGIGKSALALEIARHFVTKRISPETQFGEADRSIPSQYDLAAIRCLIEQAFDARGFHRLCQDNTDLRPVISHFPNSASLQDMIDVTVQYCEQQRLLDELLSRIRKANPRQYSRHEDQIFAHPASPHGRFDYVLWIDARPQMLTGEGIFRTEQKIQNLDDVYDLISKHLDQDNNSYSLKKSIVTNQLLTRKRVLLVIDNFETVVGCDEHALSFVQGVPFRTKIIVTSRYRVDTAESIRLGGLTQTDAQKLVAIMARSRGISIGDKQARQLAQLTDGIPLAIEWSIARIAAGYPVAQVLGELKQPKSDLVRFCYERVIESIQTTPTYRPLLALSMFDGEAGGQVLGFVADLQTPESDEALVKLEKRCLVSSRQVLAHSRMYSMLPPTQDFVSAELNECPDLRRDMEERLEILSKNNNLPLLDGQVVRQQDFVKTMELLLNPEGRPVLIVHGKGGYGKSTLALSIAWQCWQQMEFTGYMWLNVEGQSSPLDRILDGILRFLKHDSYTGFPPRQKRNATRTLLRNASCTSLRRDPYLIVVDGLARELKDDSLDFLQSISEYSRVVITSRHRHSLRNAEVVDLASLREEEARSLIRAESRRLDLHWLAIASDEELSPLVTATLGIPLVIELSVGLIARGVALDSVVDSLHNTQNDPELTVLQCWFDVLSANERTILLVSSLFPSSVSYRVLDEATQMKEDQLQESINELLKMKLMKVQNSGPSSTESLQSFEVHPRVAEFGASILAQVPELENLILSNAVQYFEGFALENTHSHWDRFHIFDRECESILNLIRILVKKRRWRPARNLLIYTGTMYLRVRGRYRDAMDLGELVIDILPPHDDVEIELSRAWILSMMIGRCAIEMEDLDRAETALQEATVLFERVGYKHGQADATNFLAMVARKRANYEKATRLLHQVCDMLPPNSYPIAGYLSFMTISSKEVQQLHLARILSDYEAHTLPITHLELGRVYYYQDRYDEALRQFSVLKDHYNQLGDEMRLYRPLYYEGMIKQKQGQFDEASLALWQSVEVADKYNVVKASAQAKFDLAQLMMSQEPQDACRLAHEAQTVFELLGMTEQVRQIDQMLNQEGYREF